MQLVNQELTAQTTDTVNIYSVLNRLNYLNQLNPIRDYKLLKKEYLVLFDSTKNTKYIYKLIELNLANNDLDSAYNNAKHYHLSDSFSENSIKFIQLFKGEKTLLTTTNRNLKSNQNANRFDSLILICCKLINSEKIESAKAMADKIMLESNPGILKIEALSLLQNTMDYKALNKTKAVLLSIVLPGSGKYYAHRKSDAFTGFSVIASNTLACILTAKRFGGKSIWPYVFGGLATGFYAGGIYGTLKAVDNENAFLINQLKKDAYTYLLHYYNI